MLRNGGWRTASDETWEIVFEALPVKSAKYTAKHAKCTRKTELNLP